MRINVGTKVEGEKKSIADWARELNMNWATLKGRLDNGWSIENAFNTPVRQCIRKA